MGVQVRAATDRGLRRTQNEDSHGEWMPATPEERRRRGALLVVADGMGGSRAGEVASRLAVQTVLRNYREAPGENPLEDLFHAIEAANRMVHAESATHPEMAGMGTTCTAVVVRGPDAFVAHVGDSRAYLVQNGRIRQLTRDHSLVAQLVREGQLTPDQAKVDPRRNVVTRSVGVGAHVEIDAEHEPGILGPGDTVLICSDGLHGVVADDELAAAASIPDLEMGCREAIALANGRGGPDNITLILARMVAEEAGAAAAAGEGRIVAAQPGGQDLAPANPTAATARAPLGERDDPAERDPSPRAARSDAPDEVESDAAPPRPHELREERRTSSARVMLWLVVALTVLVIAIAAMAIVLQRMGRESKRLGASPTEAHFAWR